jgi:predicted DNA-binding protein with PD1-like motif
MDYRRADTPDKRLAIRLDKWEEIVASLTEICRKEGVDSALISGIGACNGAEIAHYDTEGRKYRNKTYRGMLEIVSLSGNITMKDNAPFPHLHISLGLEDFSCVGGHLVSCWVDPVCEIALIPLKIPIRREFDERTGLSLQRFTP